MEEKEQSVNGELLEGEWVPERRLTVAMNVDKLNQSEEAAWALSKFINILESNIGELGLDLTVSINPFEIKEKSANSIGYNTSACGDNVEIVEEDFDDEIEEED